MQALLREASANGADRGVQFRGGSEIDFKGGNVGGSQLGGQRSRSVVIAIENRDCPAQRREFAHGSAADPHGATGDDGKASSGGLCTGHAEIPDVKIGSAMAKRVKRRQRTM